VYYGTVLCFVAHASAVVFYTVRNIKSDRNLIGGGASDKALSSSTRRSRMDPHLCHTAQHILPHFRGRVGNIMGLPPSVIKPPHLPQPVTPGTAETPAAVSTESASDTKRPSVGVLLRHFLLRTRQRRYTLLMQEKLLQRVALFCPGLHVTHPERGRGVIIRVSPDANGISAITVLHDFVCVDMSIAETERLEIVSQYLQDGKDDEKSVSPDNNGIRSILKRPPLRQQLSQLTSRAVRAVAGRFGARQGDTQGRLSFPLDVDLTLYSDEAASEKGGSQDTAVSIAEYLASAHPSMFTFSNTNASQELTSDGSELQLGLSPSNIISAGRSPEDSLDSSAEAATAQQHSPSPTRLSQITNRAVAAAAKHAADASQRDTRRPRRFPLDVGMTRYTSSAAPEEGSMRNNTASIGEYLANAHPSTFSFGDTNASAGSERGSVPHLLDSDGPSPPRSSEDGPPAPNSEVEMLNVD